MFVDQTHRQKSYGFSINFAAGAAPPHLASKREADSGHKNKSLGLPLDTTATWNAMGRWFVTQMVGSRIYGRLPAEKPGKSLKIKTPTIATALKRECRISQMFLITNVTNKKEGYMTKR